MVYDEGFELRLGDHRFFAFSKYFPVADNKFASDCTATLVGWYRNGDAYACFRGQKQLGSLSEAVRPEPRLKSVPQYVDSIVLKAKPQTSPPLPDLPQEPMLDFSEDRVQEGSRNVVSPILLS